MSDADGPTRLFELISHSGRLSILEVLIEARRDDDDGRVSFTTLRDRSMIDDTGRFNYHLSQLVGTVVSKDDGGYRLSSHGHRITAPMMGGVYDAERATAPIETAGSCYECGSALEIRPEQTVLKLVCERGHVNNHGLLGYPGVVSDQPADQASEALGMINLHGSELAVSGTCPTCHGPVDGEIRRLPDTRLDITLPDHDDSFLFEAPCSTCGNQFGTTVGACIATHPTVVSFLYDHGTDVRRQTPWALPFARLGAERVESTGPLELAVELCREGDRLVVTVARDGTVQSTERSES